MKGKSLLLLTALAFVSFAFLAGCAHQPLSRATASVPLSAYVQPAAESRMIDRKAPLALPAAVSILFVPGKSDLQAVPYTTLHKAALDLKKKLLESPKYVSSVSIVQAGDAVEKVSLEHIRRSYATDIVILLSYRQNQRSTQSDAAGLLDATLVGMFLVSGTSVRTTTLVDAQVVHIPNNALIFRTSGTDERTASSTTHGERDTAVEESLKGLLAATAEAGNDIAAAMTRFEKYDLSQAVPLTLAAGDTRDARANDYWKKVDSYKSSGGGAFGLAPLLLALALGCWARRDR